MHQTLADVVEVADVVAVAVVVGDSVESRLDGMMTVLDLHEFPGPPSGV